MTANVAPFLYGVSAVLERRMGCVVPPVCVVFALSADIAPVLPCHSSRRIRPCVHFTLRFAQHFSISFVF